MHPPLPLDRPAVAQLAELADALYARLAALPEPRDRLAANTLESDRKADDLRDATSHAAEALGAAAADVPGPLGSAALHGRHLALAAVRASGARPSDYQTGVHARDAYGDSLTAACRHIGDVGDACRQWLVGHPEATGGR